MAESATENRAATRKHFTGISPSPSVRSPTGRSLLRLVVLSGLFLLTAAAGWTLRGWLGGSGPTDTPSTEPNTARVVRGRLGQTVKARGIVKPAPNALVRLGFPMPRDVSRRIKCMKVVEGDPVKAGDELAQLDDADLRATLEQLRADALVVERRQEAARTLEPVELRLARTVRDQAQTLAEQAQRVYERLARLRPTTAASQQEYETALSDRDVTRAKLDSAEANLAQVQTRFQTDIATLEAQKEQARAAIRSVEVQIEWSTLHAPLDGVVFAVHQRPGELTNNLPSAPALTLLDPRQLQVHLYVDEADSGKVRPGQDVTLRVEAHAGETLHGKIVRLLPQPILQENVVYYLAVVDVDPLGPGLETRSQHAPPLWPGLLTRPPPLGPDLPPLWPGLQTRPQRGLLRPEMTALAHIQVGSNEPVLWLPLAAVRSRSDGWYVRRLTASGPVDTPVQIGDRSEGRVEIRSGLAEGDKVMLDQ